jgi:hypothetical protein
MLHYERNTEISGLPEIGHNILPKPAKADLGAADRSPPSLAARLHLRGLAA